mgnify:CR=1 FL=1
MAKYQIKIMSDDDGRVGGWELYFGNKPGQDNDAEAEHISGVVRTMVSALNALVPSVEAE